MLALCQDSTVFFWTLCNFPTLVIFAFPLSLFPQWLAANYLNHKEIVCLAWGAERKGEAWGWNPLHGQVWGKSEQLRGWEHRLINPQDLWQIKENIVSLGRMFIPFPVNFLIFALTPFPIIPLSVLTAQGFEKLNHGPGLVRKGKKET